MLFFGRAAITLHRIKQHLNKPSRTNRADLVVEYALYLDDRYPERVVIDFLRAWNDGTSETDKRWKNWQEFIAAKRVDDTLRLGGYR